MSSESDSVIDLDIYCAFCGLSLEIETTCFVRRRVIERLQRKCVEYNWITLLYMLKTRDHLKLHDSCLRSVYKTRKQRVEKGQKTIVKVEIGDFFDYSSLCVICGADASKTFTEAERKEMKYDTRVFEVENRITTKMLKNNLSLLPEPLFSQTHQRVVNVELHKVRARFHMRCHTMFETFIDIKPLESFNAILALKEVHVFLKNHPEECYSLNNLNEILNLNCSITTLKQNLMEYHSEEYNITNTEPFLICSTETWDSIIRTHLREIPNNDQEERNLEVVRTVADMILSDIKESTFGDNVAKSIPNSLTVFLTNLLEIQEGRDSFKMIAKALYDAVESNCPPPVKTRRYMRKPTPVPHDPTNVDPAFGTEF